MTVTKITDAHKTKIANYIEEGLSTDKIVKKFRGKYTKGQIAAIRAHVTMGNL